MNAIVDVGGGLRGIYASGVLDRLMDMGVGCGLFIGVSAGSANGCSYLAGQARRNLRFLRDYSGRKEYMGLAVLRKTGSYLDLEYVYGTLSRSDGEDPLDYGAIAANPARFLVVASNARTGQPRYFEKSDIRQDDYSVMSASSAIPFVCRPVFIEGEPYYDGALADPVPVKKAFDLGADRVGLILTKPRNVPRTKGRDDLFAAAIERKYPLAAKNLRLRAKRYNDSVSWALEREREGSCLIVAPEETYGVDTLTRDRARLMALYEEGYRDGAALAEFFRQ
ncbi:MAG: patatin family protein [Oscillospiraceae bacterium]|nr:patatin family protein [Oscillospiraceae bacterium]